jgi:hypothetical protein
VRPMSPSPKPILAQQRFPPWAGHSVGADGVLPCRGLRNKMRGESGQKRASLPHPTKQALADPVALLTEYIITPPSALSSFSSLRLEGTTLG